MLGVKYPGEDASIDEVKDLLLKLAKFGPKHAVITGVELEDGKFGFMGYDTEKKEFYSYGNEKVDMKSHGTGDVFASTFVGALMNDKSVYDALKIAADFTRAAIKNTYEDPDSVTYGVNFESEIPFLLKNL